METPVHDTLLDDAFEALLQAQATPEALRAIDAGGPVDPLWQAFEASGFLDVMLPEAAGGAGLGFGPAGALFEACGRHALTPPVAQTLLARALLWRAGQPTPRGPIALHPGGRPGPRLQQVPGGRHAAWVLAGADGQLCLHALSSAHAWQPGGEPAVTTLACDADLGALLALLLACQMAGAMRQVLALTLQHAALREQFGRPIGQFQAVQHQIAVLAEQVEAAGIAVRAACVGPAALPAPAACAIAKVTAGEAAVRVCAIAHAVHGAIGMTEEHGLHLLTDRLREWRSAGGTESHWQQCLGRWLLDAGNTGIPEFARRALGPG